MKLQFINEIDHINFNHNYDAKLIHVLSLYYSLDIFKLIIIIYFKIILSYHQIYSLNIFLNN